MRTTTVLLTVSDCLYGVFVCLHQVDERADPSGISFFAPPCLCCCIMKSHDSRTPYLPTYWCLTFNIYLKKKKKQPWDWNGLWVLQQSSQGHHYKSDWNVPLSIQEFPPNSIWWGNIFAAIFQQCINYPVPLIHKKGLYCVDWSTCKFCECKSNITFTK